VLSTYGKLIIAAAAVVILVLMCMIFMLRILKPWRNGIACTADHALYAPTVTFRWTEVGAVSDVFIDVLVCSGVLIVGNDVD
jgi:hypothetical protein